MTASTAAQTNGWRHEGASKEVWARLAGAPVIRQIPPHAAIKRVMNFASPAESDGMPPRSPYRSRSPCRAWMSPRRPGMPRPNGCESR